MLQRLLLLILTPCILFAHLEEVIDYWELAKKEEFSDLMVEMETLLQEIRQSHGLNKEPVEINNFYWKERDIHEVEKKYIIFPANPLHLSNKRRKQQNIICAEDIEEGCRLASTVNATCPDDVQFSPIVPNGKTCIDLGEGRYEIKGGLCSASSLTFLSTFLKLKGLIANPTTLDLVQIALESTIPSKNGEDNTLAILQAAMNTINKRVEIDVHTPTFRKSKIQGLALFFNLFIEKESPYFQTSNTSYEELKEVLGKLEQGAYFFRIIRVINNDKGEKYGHSLAYIKEKTIEFFFDPNLGTVVLFPENDAAAFIFQEIIQGRYAPLFANQEKEAVGCFYKITDKN